MPRNGANKGYIRTKPYDIIKCACCGKAIPKTSHKVRVCKDKCKPKKGFKQECARCGEVKKYEDFYDYRGGMNRGKLLTTCKKCIRAAHLAAYHREKEQKEMMEA